MLVNRVIGLPDGAFYRSVCVTARTMDGTTPVYIASQQGNSEPLKILLTARADPNAVNVRGKRASEVAEEVYGELPALMRSALAPELRAP